MPRGKPRTTQTGAPAQKVRSVPGQRYGEGKQSNELQAAMPAPDMVKATAPSPAPQGAPVMPGPPVDPMQVQEFLGRTNPNMLGGSQLPDQPVTEGLSTGPGRGPQALNMNTTPVARYLQRLSAETGNSKWRRLAERAGL